jgi:hypothetical protein
MYELVTTLKEFIGSSSVFKMRTNKTHRALAHPRWEDAGLQPPRPPTHTHTQTDTHTHTHTHTQSELKKTQIL